MKGVLVGSFELYCMNWYNRFIRFAFRNPIETDSIAIVQEIFKQLKQLYINQDRSLRTQTMQYKPSPNLNGLSLDSRYLEIIEGMPNQRGIEDRRAIREKLVFHINIHQVATISEVQMGGLTIENDIEININIPNNFSERFFENLYALLFETVRHEIKHYVDLLHGKTPQEFRQRHSLRTIDNIRDASNYMLSKTEHMPFINGILLRAKRSMVPFEQAAMQTIDKVFATFDNNYYKPTPPSDLQEIQRIRQDILAFIIRKASIIYPGAKSK